MPVQTIPFQSLIEVDKKSSIPVYQQVASGLIKLISGGVVKPGFPLPSSRTMASIMQLNRTTVVAAYEELRVQDWIEVSPRKGVYISKQLPVLKPIKFEKPDNTVGPGERSDPGYFFKFGTKSALRSDGKSYNLVVNDGYPDSRIAPLSILLSKYRSLMGKSYMDGLFMNGQSAGSKNLREELAAFLSKTRAIDIDLENVLVTRGAQVAIFIAARMILKPGSKVIIGDPNYNLANGIFEQFGAELIRVRVDEQGIDVDEIEKICKAARPDLLYIIPHHHHPTTVTLSAERRMRLLNIIHKYQLPVIEDDYDYDFHYDNCPILPLASADHAGYVIYIGSITKTLAPTVRIGYLVAGKDFVWHAARLKEVMEIRGDVLMEEAIASLFNSGEMQRHITRSVKLYKTRRDTFCDLLSAELNGMVEFDKPLGGMAVWTRFNSKYSLPALAKKVAIQGIYINDGSLYHSNGISPNALRLGFASMNEAEMINLIQELKRLRQV